MTEAKEGGEPLGPYRRDDTIEYTRYPDAGEFPDIRRVLDTFSTEFIPLISQIADGMSQQKGDASLSLEDDKLSTLDARLSSVGFEELVSLKGIEDQRFYMYEKYNSAGRPQNGIEERYSGGRFTYSTEQPTYGSRQPHEILTQEVSDSTGRYKIVVEYPNVKVGDDKSYHESVRITHDYDSKEGPKHRELAVAFGSVLPFGRESRTAFITNNIPGNSSTIDHIEGRFDDDHRGRITSAIFRPSSPNGIASY